MVKSGEGSGPGGLRWTVRSKGDVVQVVKHIGNLMASEPMDEDAVSDFLVAAQEAVVNAVEHGNLYEPGKQVVVGLQKLGAAMELWVRDQGPGFDPGTVPDPTRDEFIEQILNDERPARGWGLHIIKCLSDRVDWNDSGNEIRIFKHCGLPN